MAMPSIVKSKFIRSRKCEWIFVVFMFAVLIAIGTLTIVIAVRGKDAAADRLEEEKGRLMGCHILFRHGARTPTFLQADDPYLNFSWPEGLGGLTVHGKERMYDYGQALYGRYKRYIDVAPVRNIIAESSPVRRCLETTAAVLAGMFSPSDSQVWSEFLGISRRWQPIGVSTVEAKRAYMLGDGFDCPVATAMTKRIDSFPETKKFLANNSDFIRRFTNHSGYDAIENYGIIASVHDSLTCEENYFGDQFKWPAWMEAVGSDCLQKMKAFRDFGFDIEGQLGVPYFRLRAGTFLKTLLQRLNSTISLEKVDETNRQFNVYGSHDTMCAWILHALGFPRGQPNFGEGIITELRADPQTQTPMVHLYYANLTEGVRLVELRLNESTTFKGKCGGVACPFDDFAASLQVYLSEHIEQECGAQWT